MEKDLIFGVKIIPRQQILDERGKIMHMLKKTDPEFGAFGEVYFSCVEPGAIKAWHLHKKMTLNYCVPIGKIKLVLYDGRRESPSFGKIVELFLGPDNYNLVVIPPFVWNGFKGISTSVSLVANCATEVHDKSEIIYLDPRSKEIDYKWEIVNK